MVTVDNAAEDLELFCSEPTVWDGDHYCRQQQLRLCIGSEPTVWDGDVVGKEVFLRYLPRSEPTVWDGDTGSKDRPTHRR